MKHVMPQKCNQNNLGKNLMSRVIMAPIEEANWHRKTWWLATIVILSLPSLFITLPIWQSYFQLAHCQSLEHIHLVMLQYKILCEMKKGGWNVPCLIKKLMAILIASRKYKSHAMLETIAKFQLKYHLNHLNLQHSNPRSKSNPNPE